MGQLDFGARLRALRQERSLTQDEAAELLGFNHHQTISQIESGERAFKAHELVRMSEAFGVPLGELTDPFLIAGEARFSWRQQGVASPELNSFERRAGEWIGAYRELAKRAGTEPPPFLPRVPLGPNSSFEEASAAGERVAKELGLTDVPSQGLAAAVESKLNTLVLMVDVVPGISGAACHLPELSTILINREEPAARRSFDLAHEAFHILTWDAMPPEHLDGAGQGREQRRIEQLADNFASALLMPRSVLERFGRPHAELVGWLNATATELGVSSLALKWRIVTIGGISLATARAVPDDELRNNGGLTAGSRQTPHLFSRPFIKVIADALERGDVSARRVQKLLGMSGEEIRALCANHGVQPPAEL
jgi:Zn-dependent peptidase ImmA (M78 family)/DNA-binding XRE family transcriptional regulator